MVHGALFRSVACVLPPIPVHAGAAGHGRDGQEKREEDPRHCSRRLYAKYSFRDDFGIGNGIEFQSTAVMINPALKAFEGSCPYQLLTWFPCRK